MRSYTDSTPPLSGWHPGQKVICIDDGFNVHLTEFYDHLPKKGHIYTISEIHRGTQYGTKICNLGIRLHELQPIAPCSQNFGLWRFRLFSTQDLTAGAGVVCNVNAPGLTV